MTGSATMRFSAVDAMKPWSAKASFGVNFVMIVERFQKVVIRVKQQATAAGTLTSDQGSGTLAVPA